jgi:hypothetical protein
MNETSRSRDEHYNAAEILITRDRQDLTAIAQVHAILALASDVSELKAGLTDVQASLSMIYDALGSIERTIGPPRRT